MPIGRTDVTKRQRRFDLPGAIPLHQGLALVGPAATAVPAEHAVGHCQLEQSEGDFRRFASVIHQVACDL